MNTSQSDSTGAVDGSEPCEPTERRPRGLDVSDGVGPAPRRGRPPQAVPTLLQRIDEATAKGVRLIDVLTTDADDRQLVNALLTGFAARHVLARAAAVR